MVFSFKLTVGDGVIQKAHPEEQASVTQYVNCYES
jgi:hypothetical protein